MSRLTDYRGISFSAREPTAKKWRPALARKGKVFALGLYETPSEAARAYDNAVYYTQIYAQKRAVYNFPQEWTETAVVRKPTEHTKRMLATLRTMFPGYEDEQKRLRTLTDGQTFDKAMWKQLGIVDDALRSVKTVAQQATVRVLELEKDNARLRKENEGLARAVEGLRAQGGGQMFRKVEAGQIKPDAVERHLDEG